MIPKLSRGARDSYIGAVRRLGGEVLADKCSGTVLKDLGAVTCGCGATGRASLPTPKGPVILCAICDRGVDAPRIRKAA